MARIWLKELRLKKKLTQDKIAQKVGISKTLYNRIENAERDGSGLVQFLIAQELNFPMEYFYTKGDAPKQIKEDDEK